MIDTEILKKFQTISLEEMGKVRLMNRIDTKFVAPIQRIEELLKLCSDSYIIQQIEGCLNMPYYTKYFDTPDVDMFYQHQRGKKNRQKIRMRLYEGSDTLPFIEIKTKNNKGRTRKNRMAMDEGWDINNYSHFLSKHTAYETLSLRPVIENHFFRITLVNKEMTERITIDSNLEFHNLVTDTRLGLPHLGIIEWKRDGRNCNSGFGTLLRRLRIMPQGFSKYCIGMAATNPSLRQNRLKPRLRKLGNLSDIIQQ